MIIIPIEDKVYRANPTALVNCSANELRECVERVIKEKWRDFNPEDRKNKLDYGAVYKIETEGKTYNILWLREFNWTIHDLSHLVHEVRHLVDSVLGDRGIKLSDFEATAYYNEFIINEILTKINMACKGKKKKK
jgi:hypothetical protein